MLNYDDVIFITHLIVTNCIKIVIILLSVILILADHRGMLEASAQLFSDNNLQLAMNCRASCLFMFGLYVASTYPNI